jgi:hypothetical protein
LGIFRILQQDVDMDTYEKKQDEALLICGMASMN